MTYPPLHDNELKYKWGTILLATIVLGSLAVYFGSHRSCGLDKAQNHLTSLKQSFFKGSGPGIHEVVEFTTENGTYCVYTQTGTRCNFKGAK